MNLRQWLLQPAGGSDLPRLKVLVYLLLSSTTLPDGRALRELALRGESPDDHPAEFLWLIEFLGPRFWAGFRTVRPQFPMPSGSDTLDFAFALLNDTIMTLYDLQITEPPSDAELQDMLSRLELAIGFGL